MVDAERGYFPQHGMEALTTLLGITPHVAVQEGERLVEAGTDEVEQ